MQPQINYESVIWNDDFSAFLSKLRTQALRDEHKKVATDTKLTM